MKYLWPFGAHSLKVARTLIACVLLWLGGGSTLVAQTTSPARLVLADFNRDNFPDSALLNSSTMQTAIWYLHGATFAGSIYGPTLPAGWMLEAAADFNADAKQDYLLFNATTRQTAIWHLNGATFTGGHYGPTLPVGWTLAAAADFNADAKQDCALFNTGTRQTAIWYLNGATLTGSRWGPTLPVGWTLEAVADFSADAKPDYVLFNASTRQTAIWYLNGATFAGSRYGPTLPIGWTVEAVADFNADAKPDYVLFNATTRQTAIWYLNGAMFTGSAYGPTLPVGWGSAPTSTATQTRAHLTAVDVQRIITQAVTRAVNLSPNSVIAVTDREGYVLGVWNVRGGQPTAPEIASCVSKAGTAAFLSSNQNAFTSRTAGFIIQQHFPPGVGNTPTGPLVGVGLSNLFFSDVNRFKKTDMISSSASPGTRGSPIFGTSLDGVPGGVPLYKNGHLVGGVGVTGDGTPPPITGFRSENPFIFVPGYDKDEDVALAGQKGYQPSPDILATNVYINGISLEYTGSTTSLPASFILRGNIATGFPIQGSPAPFPYQVAVFGGVQGQIRQPIISDPLPGAINGQPRLSAAEVARIINFAADRARTTRAGIRLPIGTKMQVFISVVNFPDRNGVAPTVLGTFRTGEATIFSWDVSVQKARTAVAYSNNGNTLAMSTRTVGFLAQSNYPPGIDANQPGPFFGQQETFSGLLGTLANVTPNPSFIPRPNLPNGITIFPGGFPLYRSGQMIGAIGISGDGVDQDDIVAASGTHDFLTPEAIRADQTVFRGARLPYAKFPRDPNDLNTNNDAIAMDSPRGITAVGGLAGRRSVWADQRIEGGTRFLFNQRWRDEPVSLPGASAQFHQPDGLGRSLSRAHRGGRNGYTWQR